MKKLSQNQQELICDDQLKDSINVSSLSVVKHAVVYKVLNVLGTGLSAYFMKWTHNMELIFFSPYIFVP